MPELPGPGDWAIKGKTGTGVQEGADGNVLFGTHACHDCTGRCLRCFRIDRVTIHADERLASFLVAHELQRQRVDVARVARQLGKLAPHFLERAVLAPGDAHEQLPGLRRRRVEPLAREHLWIGVALVGLQGSLLKVNRASATLPQTATALTWAGTIDRDETGTFDAGDDTNVSTLSGSSVTSRIGYVAQSTLVTSLALTHTPREVQFYCLDFGGGSLAALRDLPHVGGVAARLDAGAVHLDLRAAARVQARRHHRLHG